ncbi:MAG: flavodoxin family protein [Paludibacteraceae bacterium]|nr:flavodoxin family protein [Paludibacteraceae bacterium]
MKAIFVNGSPRKNKNTAQMLQSAMRGAQEAGAEVELVHLYDIQFQGCKSCFACKLKNSKCNGLCAIKDDLRPLLERCQHADVLVFGSPVYYSYPTGILRSFMERLMFPMGTYMYEYPEGEANGHRGKHIVIRDKVIHSAIIFTMNCPYDYMEQIGYPPILEENTKCMADIFGYAETLYACNTYQFNDYSKYDFNLFSEEDKRKYRDQHFPIDLQNAYELGKRLAEKAK